MQKSPDQDPSYLVYHFEMGSLNGLYSNVAYSNVGDTTHICGSNTGPQDPASLESGNAVLQCPQNPNIESFYDVIGRSSDQGTDTSAGDELGGVRHNPLFAVYDRCDDQFASSRCKRQTSAEQSDGGLYVNLSENQGRLRQGGKHQQQDGKRKQAYDTTAGAAPGNQHRRVVLPCCDKTRLMGTLQITIFLMAATSLALVIMTINGTIVCCADTLGDTAKTEKQTHLSLRFDELQDQISKLKEELNDARKEIKELKDNSTTQVNRHSGKAEFELKLNSTQQTFMTMISEVQLLVNKTNKELWEETHFLRSTENATQEEIHKLADSLTKLEDKVRLQEQRFNKTIQLKLTDSLTKLEDKVRLQEQRFNKTIQLKVKHRNDVHSLELLINSSRQDVMNKLNQMWSTVNTTGKGLQARMRSSRMALWTALNATSMALQQKIYNASKMTGPIGPPGFNGSQGPAGPLGSPGPPGPKGSGNFSLCKYRKATGSPLSGSHDSDASVVEPSGSIIIGATCSTNYAPEYNLLTSFSSNQRKYICNCKGPEKYFIASGPKTCVLHYWLCTKT